MPPVTTPIAFTTEEIEAVAFDADGLVPAIVQEQGTNQVLMFAWMNRDALVRTLLLDAFHVDQAGTKPLRIVVDADRHLVQILADGRQAVRCRHAP